jgi:CRISPR-associated endonuclease/helicase Cas3
VPGTEGHATIVRDPDTWLYTDDESAAWDWLRSLERADGSIDVSVAALDADQTRPLPHRTASAPTLTPEIVERLAETAPRPGSWQNPDVDAFLRGRDSNAIADVAICWRCDLRPEIGSSSASGYREMLLELVPPQRQELLTLSVPATRALLAAQYPGERRSAKAEALTLTETDVEGESLRADIPEGGQGDESVPFLIIRGNEVRHGTFAKPAGDRVLPGELSPGDILVLPTSAGGVDDNGLAPGPARQTSDVAGDLRPNGMPAPVRISPMALGNADGPTLTPRLWGRVAQHCRRAEGESDALDTLVQRLRTLLPGHSALEQVQPKRLRADGWRLLLRVVTPLDDDGKPSLDEREAIHPDDVDDLVVVEEKEEEEEEEEGSHPRDDQRWPLDRTWVLLPVPEARRERHERRSQGRTASPPTLEAHAHKVRERLEQSLQVLGLPEPVQAALSIAAAAHDQGKADPRIQSFFRRGAGTIGAPPIAKSEFGTDDPRTSRLARRIAGMPRRLDHEISSVAILAQALDSGVHHHGVLEVDLALHLVATHHGRGRAIPRVPVGGEEPRAFHVDIAGIAGTGAGDGLDGWADGEWLARFWRVLEHYGSWGAAYLEAVLIRADHIVSAGGE